MESVICITGASQGIGRALATYFSDRGHHVFNLTLSVQQMDRIPLRHHC